MALYVVATPIGNQEDLSPRALRTLKTCALVICEEFREASTLLKFHGITGKNLESLNEHSTRDDLKNLVEQCRNQDVALISDCGTPGFCDPGADLVNQCRAQNIQVISVPGPSSLMAFLSLSGQRLDQFQFNGFLPADRETRAQALKKIKSSSQAHILMDTPYRLPRLLEDLERLQPDRLVTVGLNLSCANERVVTGTAQQVSQQLKSEKAEFILLFHASAQNQNHSLARRKSKKK